MSAPTKSTATKSTASRGLRQHLLSGLLGLLVGSFAVNAVPHLANGLAGNMFRTPFGAESSATVNLLWGLANLGFAVGIGLIARHRIRSTAFALGAGAGVLGTGVSLLLFLS